MFGGSRRGRNAVNIWPGFVDALATILLAFVFVLMLFVVTQFYLSDALSGKSRALQRLQDDVERLAEELSMERGKREHLQERMSSVYNELHTTLSERDSLAESLKQAQGDKEQLKSELAEKDKALEVSREKLKVRLTELASLQADIDTLRKVRKRLEEEVGALSGKLGDTEQSLTQARDRSKALSAELADAKERTHLAQKAIEERTMRIRDLVAEIDERDQALSEQKGLTADAETRIERLRNELRALRDQIQRVARALSVSQETVSEQRTRIEDLGERLNLALAERVEKLSRYRSEFFGRLREVLGDIQQIRIVGDRFMFQSELFFDSGSAQIGADGQDKLRQLADVLKQVAQRIPGDIPWVLQVEGHTDRRPINTERFPSNWELSTARATNIVHFLIDQGIPAERLAAAGYGEYQPLTEGDSPEAMARNRRIELKLTRR
ncbi:peptidoglycan -binding protein [Arhodomonas aquaeolei]|uniref:peptidoglycan -binding protein n=1 Tax=Arhodomonas TaxID=2368 RepID=UPI0003795F69|nr:peptidoglycan -binding protein [Arhodomonas aquaeolei]MCS4504819.1 peptidoglycan -binding protein [Arhodomonas aquaeolei]